MLRAVFAAMLVAPVAAAPVPKEDDAARMRRIYGTPEDPDKDCTFKMVGDKLRIEIPAKHHSMNPNPGFMNAPRVVGEVEGDFTAVVRVTFPIRPAPGPKADEDFNKFATGGLVAWVSDEENCQVLRREQDVNGKPREKFVRCLRLRNYTGVSVGGIGPAVQDWPDAGYLRLTRDGKKLRAAHSRDGKEWKEHDAVEAGWGGKVKVGLIAENGYNAPFEVTFDEYKLTVPKK